MRKKRVAKLITYMCANLHAYGMIQPNVLAHTSRVFRCSYHFQLPETTVRAIDLRCLERWDQRRRTRVLVRREG